MNDDSGENVDASSSPASEGSSPSSASSSFSLDSAATGNNHEPASPSPSPAASNSIPALPARDLSRQLKTDSNNADNVIRKLKTGQGHSRSSRFLTASYRNFLNSMIEDVSARTTAGLEPQRPSQVGASFWSVEEKEVFFKALASHGIGGLPAVADAIGTKNVLEVRAYILLLQRVLREGEVAKLPGLGDVVRLMPAACEVSGDCELVLEAAADTLAAHVDRLEEGEEKAEKGEGWLIDEDVAERIEREVESMSVDVEREANKDEESKMQAETLRIGQEEMLLRPAMFLQLSRNLFMNNEADPERNWRYVDALSDATDSPAMLKSALEEFYSLAVGLTRRLVQVCLIQTMSRLRAEDAMRSNFTHVASVREIDVRTAVDVLGMGLDWRRYWATAARRCQVGVFSNQGVHNDGRPRTKHGFRITYNEVEVALGLDEADRPVGVESVGDSEMDDDEVSAMIDTLDTDTFADTVSDYGNGGHSTTDFTTDDEQRLGTAEGRGAERRNKKRKFNTDQNNRLHNNYLEALDQNASVEEEQRLWAAMRLEPPKSLSTDQMIKPGDYPARKSRADGTSTEWRENTDYEAAWEGVEALPPPEAFRRMHIEGQRAQKRRKVLYGRVRERLQDGDSSNEEDSFESSDAADDGDIVKNGSSTSTSEMDVSDES